MIDLRASLRAAYHALRDATELSGNSDDAHHDRIKAAYWEVGNLLEDIGATPEEILYPKKARQATSGAEKGEAK